MVQCRAQCDFRKPVMERRAPIEPVQEPPGLDEGFLGEVLDLLKIAFITVQDGKDLGLVPPDNFRKIVHGPVANPLQQFSVVIHRRSAPTGRGGTYSARRLPIAAMAPSTKSSARC